MTRLWAKELDSRCLAGRQLCCIGPRTAQELEKYGVKADLIPTDYQAEGVLEALVQQNLKETRILIPRAEVARALAGGTSCSWCSCRRHSSVPNRYTCSRCRRMAAAAHGSFDTCCHLHKFFNCSKLCVHARRSGRREAARAICGDRVYRTHHSENRRGVWIDRFDYAERKYDPGAGGCNCPSLSKP